MSGVAALCPHGDVHPACCPDCLDGPPLVPAKRDQRVEGEGHWIAARYDGWCKNGCGRFIDAGDLIRRLADGAGYGCEGCVR